MLISTAVTARAIALPPLRWHRPLLALAAVLAIAIVPVTIGWLVDDRQLQGVGVWAKPLKFLLSGVLYAVTWSWIIGQFTRWRRAAWWAGTIITVTLAVELVIIIGFAAVGLRSHFAVDTPLATTAWAIMAAAITTLWVATLVAALALWRNPGADQARTAALRTGVVISLIGMGLAFLMTGPTADQLGDFQGVAGAHAVGVDDGGPGIPLLGWSTEGGDLRIPHFIGMHALQAIPLLALGLELLARRVTVLARVTARRSLVRVGASTWLAVTALVTVQALRGQSIVQPDAATFVAGAAIAVMAAAATTVVLHREVRAPRSAGRSLAEQPEREAPSLSA